MAVSQVVLGIVEGYISDNIVDVMNEMELGDFIDAVSNKKNIMQIITKQEIDQASVRFIKYARQYKNEILANYNIYINGLIKYITSSPIIAMVWEGSNAVEAIRQTIGSTNPIEAAPGSIRHDLAIITSRNLVHASDSLDTAKKEISLWFDDNNIYPWGRLHEDWFTGLN